MFACYCLYSLSCNLFLFHLPRPLQRDAGDEDGEVEEQLRLLLLLERAYREGGLEGEACWARATCQAAAAAEATSFPPGSVGESATKILR